MKRLGLAFAMAALLGLGACGGSGSDQAAKPAPATTTAEPLQLADACPKVQDALDNSFAGIGEETEADYQRFADDIALLLDTIDPKGEAILTNLWEASKYSVSARKVGSRPSTLLEVDGEWLDAMKQVTDTCQQLGAPLS